MRASFSTRWGGGRTIFGVSSRMGIKAPALRENIYRTLDEVLETGMPVRDHFPRAVWN